MTAREGSDRLRELQLPGGKALATPLRRIVLRGRAAAGLAAVLDSVSPLTADVRHCENPSELLPFDQLSPVQDDLFGYTMAVLVSCGRTSAAVSLALAANGRPATDTAAAPVTPPGALSPIAPET